MTIARVTIVRPIVASKISWATISLLTAGQVCGARACWSVPHHTVVIHRLGMPLPSCALKVWRFRSALRDAGTVIKLSGHRMRFYKWVWMVSLMRLNVTCSATWNEPRIMSSQLEVSVWWPLHSQDGWCQRGPCCTDVVTLVPSDDHLVPPDKDLVASRLLQSR
jgi:hypothetical protein